MRFKAGLAPLFTEKRAVITPQTERLALLLAKLMQAARQPAGCGVQPVKDRLQ